MYGMRCRSLIDSVGGWCYSGDVGRGGTRNEDDIYQ